MKTVSVTEAKNRLSALLDLVRKGVPVLILDHKVPVARLEPIRNQEAWSRDRLRCLEREGLVRLPGRKLNLKLFTPKTESADSSGVLEGLIEERRGGR